MNTTAEERSLHYERAEDFILELESRDIRLWMENSILRYKAPKGAVTPEILGILKEKKEEILAFLEESVSNSAFFEAIPNVGEREYYPLSAAQNRMLILNRLDPKSKAYNITQVLRMEGEVDRACLADILQKLVERHESLRTTFDFADDKAVQRIHPAAEVQLALDYTEISDMDALDSVLDEFVQPYALDKLPLFRVKLVRVLREEAMPLYFLALDMHHIISDGVSLAVLVYEINQMYADKPLPELKVRYVDFAAWYDKLLSGKVMERQKKYWIEQFAGELPAFSLSTDFQRPATFTFNGGHIKRQIDRGLTDRLYALARENKVTLYTVLFSAFSVLIGRYVSQRDVIIGTPTAGRRHADVQNIIGNFVNTLAIRTYPEPHKSFTDFLRETGRFILQAFDNQDYPFEQLVNDLKIERDMSRNPLFDVMFILQNMNSAPIEAQGIEISDYDTGKGIAQVDITAICVENENGIDLGIDYCVDLFKKESMERLVGHYLNILEEVSRFPERALSEIEMLSEAESACILYTFNNTKADYRQDTTMHALFEEQVCRIPNETALLFQEQTLTYAQLNEKANRLAHALRKRGVGRDDIVAVIAERSPEMMAGILAVLKAGGAYLPISPEYPKDRIRYMLEDSGAKGILTQNRHYPVAFDALDGLEAESHWVIDLDDEGAVRMESGENPPPVNSPRDLAYIIYTSGSTGRPKGVMIEHRSLINRLNWMQKKYPIGENDVILQKTPYTFDVSVWELFWWGMMGTKVCFLVPGGEKDPAEITAAIEKYGVTTMHFVPSMLGAFLDYVDESGEVGRLRSLKQVFASGEALAVKQAEWFNRLIWKKHGTTLNNLYGPTEATVDVSYFDCSTGKKLDVIPIGKPIDNIKLLVVDENRRLQPIGVPGELCIAGDGLARGYLNKPELTAEKFILSSYADFSDGRMYRTGDLARWLPDGNIEYLGRMDSQIKLRGFRIELGEIEAELLKHPDIREAAVVVKELRGDKCLCAYIAMERELTVPELREYLMKGLPEYMVPMHFVPMEKLPLTFSGKVDRKALPAPNAGISTGVEYEAPRNEAEETLADIWKDILGLEQVGIQDDFFVLGGDSLKAIKVVERANRANMQISLPDILRSRTIAEILGTPSDHKPAESEKDMFSFDKMLRRNDRKKIMVCGARERHYNKDYAPIEYPFYYKCTLSVLTEYIKHVCRYDLELDFLNMAIGEGLIGLEYTEDINGNVVTMRPINGNDFYPNALEKLGIGMLIRQFPDRESGIEYIHACLIKNQIVPVSVSTYHLNYTCDYHLTQEVMLEKIEYLKFYNPEMVATMHTAIVIDETKDSFVLHDTTFGYFGEVSKEDFYKAFEGVRSLEVLGDHPVRGACPPFEAVEMDTQGLIRTDMHVFGLEELRRNVRDYLADNDFAEKQPDGGIRHRVYGLKAVQKVIEQYRTCVVGKPYDAAKIGEVHEAYNFWGGRYTLFRNAVRMLKQYHPIEGDVADLFERPMMDCNEIGAMFEEYDKEHHEVYAAELEKKMTAAYAAQKQLLEKLAAAIQA